MVQRITGPSLLERLTQKRPQLTPKGAVLADYVAANPREAVFMSTRALARACGVSEATVVRFVAQLDYDGYTEFIQALRDYIDAEMTLLERVDLTDMSEPESQRLGRVVLQEIDNLKALYESLDAEAIGRVADLILDRPEIHVVGSRLSQVFAHYMGWSLTKIRGGVRILSGSDSTTIDWLTIAPDNCLVILFAASRYPNELIRTAKLVRRLGHALVVISDSALSPLNPFGDISLVVPSRHFPIMGSPSAFACLVNCLIVEIFSRGGEKLRRHQEKLETAYREQDILFNLDEAGPGSHLT